MRFRLSLNVKRGSVLPLNYQYPISSWIYKCINNADSVFAKMLHEKGYPGYNSSKKFKFFNFSRLQVPDYDIYEDRMIIKSDEVGLNVSFLIEGAAERFISGVFQNQHCGIGDAKSQVDFHVGRIEAKPEYLSDKLFIITGSPIVIAKPKTEGEKYAKYLSPLDDGYEAHFCQNLIRKYESYMNYIGNSVTEAINEPLSWKLEKGAKVRKAGVTIKANTPQQSQVIGYNYQFSVAGPEEILKIGLSAGFGEKNSLGFGYGRVKI